tara:strand:+ start:109 stop:462 length:354 start_codon:yes stop_codon:yes gene_type:complete
MAESLDISIFELLRPQPLASVTVTEYIPTFKSKKGLVLERPIDEFGDHEYAYGKTPPLVLHVADPSLPIHDINVVVILSRKNSSGSSMLKNIKDEDPVIVHPVKSVTKTLYAPADKL